ncbi:hypothetical protein BK797_05825 [Kosakonia sacchari]|nr:hypothetical protein BK797_05825 [Kosakonia sacchari]
MIPSPLTVRPWEVFLRRFFPFACYSGGVHDALSAIMLNKKCINLRNPGYNNPAFLLRIISTQFYFPQIK